ncbi:hypothetical protein K1719_008709 [Acacia pycnantha]|nr:hypothetical protein K1719_008709 [Acacia pycnantha]
MEAVKEMIARDDHIAARDKLLQLQRQFPAIDEFSSMITVCEVLNSASHDFIAIESDWYLILQVPQAASQQDVEFQYNKIANLLKPIKTHTPAAESALEIVEEAYSVLSNPEKRTEFDKKRNAMFEACEVLNVQQIPPTPSKSEVDNVFSYKNSRLNMFINEKACVKGDVNFAATRPSNSSLSFKGFDQGHFSLNSIESSELFKVGQVWAANDHECMPRNYFRIKEIEKSPLRLHVNSLRAAQLSSYELFRSEVCLTIVCGQFNVDKSKDQIIVPAILSHVVCSYADEQVLIFPKEQEVWAMYRELDPMIKCSNDKARKSSKLEVVEIVTGYTDTGNMLAARLDKVDGQKNVFARQKESCQEQFLSIPSDNLYRFSHRIPVHRYVGEDMDGMFELDPYAVPPGLNSTQSMTRKERSDSESKSFDPENKLSLKDFACNQIWAVRNNVEVIPRRYVIVNNVTSEGEICVTFLEPSLTCTDEKHRMEQGLPIGCGSFSAGKTIRILGLHHFSHLMKCERNQEDFSFVIYPRKGEVWARYKNWNGKWEQSDLVCCQYQIVEIISDLAYGSDEIAVLSLIEVPGFMTLFQRQHYNGYEWIPRAEFLSFSHRIVASCVQAAKDSGVSAPFWHLESDSLDCLNSACSRNIL